MSELEQKYAEVVSALLYTLECNLATVDNLCMTKKPSMLELRRQITIAQLAVDTFLAVGYLAERQGGRIEKVISYNNRSVMKYAKALRDKWHPDKPIKD